MDNKFLTYNNLDKNNISKGRDISDSDLKSNLENSNDNKNNEELIILDENKTKFNTSYSKRTKEKKFVLSGHRNQKRTKYNKILLN